MNEIKKELACLDISVLIRYAVPEEEVEHAISVAEKFKNHPVARRLLRSYYEALPGGREEMASDIRLVARTKGASLLALRTAEGSCHLYLCTEEEALHIGKLEDGLPEREVLQFFGYENEQAFLKAVPDSYEKLERLALPGDTAVQPFCASCGVPEGEYHILGCPVEQCPWCDAQLNHCNCRFDQLGVDIIDSEELLEEFSDLLEAKGRIAFNRSHNPAYPTGGRDQGPAVPGDGEKIDDD